jgi:hypothetical protein
MIHALYDNQRLARELNTPESLREDPEFRRALAFIRKQAPTSRTRVKPAKHRRRRS